jgi:hypothetical protein
LDQSFEIEKREAQEAAAKAEIERIRAEAKISADAESERLRVELEQTALENKKLAAEVKKLEMIAEETRKAKEAE